MPVPLERGASFSCSVGILPKELFADVTTFHHHKEGPDIPIADAGLGGGYWDYFASEEVELPRRSKG